MRERVTERKSRSLRQKRRRDDMARGVRVDSLGASRTGLGNDVAKDVDGAFTAGTVDVAVGYEADGVWGGVERPDAVGLQSFAELDGVEAGGFAVEDDDVSFDGRGIDAEAGDLRDLARKELGVGVIFVKALGRFFEGDEACRGEDASLAHATAEHFAVDAGFVDEALRADDHGAYGRAETLRQAEHY